MNINQISSPQLTFKNFSPATGIASGSRRLASRTLPLTIWYFIKGRPQTEQVEGFITLVTQDQLVILTCKDRRTQHCWQCSTAPLPFLIHVHVCLRVWIPWSWSSKLPNTDPPEQLQALVRAEHHSSSFVFLSRQGFSVWYTVAWNRGAPPAPACQVVESQVHPSIPSCFCICTWRLKADISYCI